MCADSLELFGKLFFQILSLTQTRNLPEFFSESIILFLEKGHPALFLHGDDSVFLSNYTPNREGSQKNTAMSHFIQNCNIGPSPIFKQCTPKKIVSPKYRQIIKSSYKNPNPRAYVSEQYHISQLCKKLTDREYSMLRVQNALEIRHQISKLKGKLKKQMDEGSISVQKFFQRNPNKLFFESSKIKSESPQQIRLEHKYGHKLANCRSILEETRGVLMHKEGYRTWLDNHNNSPVKSPNFTRMNFVLEKLNDSGAKVLDSLSSNKENGVIIRCQKMGYRGKLRKIHTEQSDF